MALDPPDETPVEKVVDESEPDESLAGGDELQELIMPRAIMKRIINHKDSGATASYDLYSYYGEKRDALQKWADRLDEICK